MARRDEGQRCRHWHLSWLWGIHAPNGGCPPSAIPRYQQFTATSLRHHKKTIATYVSTFQIIDILQYIPICVWHRRFKNQTAMKLLQFSTKPRRGSCVSLLGHLHGPHLLRRHQIDGTRRCAAQMPLESLMYTNPVVEQ